MATRREQSVIDRPIFILGPGRAGSTLLNNLITLHRDVGYFTAWSNRFPQLPALAVGSRLRVPAVEPWVTRREIRGYPGATEAYNIWKYCFPDFWKAVRKPCTNADGANRLRSLIRVHLRVESATRFVSKLTGPPMMEFFTSIFPDAQYIRMERDPRAVAYSYIEKGWLGAPAGVAAADVPRQEQLRLAARRFLGHLNELKAERGEYLVVTYEALTAGPIASLCRIEAYAGLAHDVRLERRVRHWPISSANNKWQERLEPEERALLTHLLEEPLAMFGYL